MAECSFSPQALLRQPAASGPSPLEPLLASLHAMWMHWRRSPLCRARFPPPSITPRTAWMPRAALRFARLLASLVERLSMSNPSPFAPMATLRRRTLVPFLLTRNPSPSLRLTTFRRTMLSTPPTDPSGKSIPRRMPRSRASTTTFRATRLWRPFSIPMPDPSREKWLRVSTFRLPGPTRMPSLFRTKRLPRTSLRLPGPSPPIRTPGLECENRFPLITLWLEAWTWMPGPGLSLIELSAILMWSESNTPIPSPSGGMLGSASVEDHASG